MSKTVVHRFKDFESVADNTAQQLVSELIALLETKAEVHLMLTGGSVGIATLASLAENPLRAQIDFTRVHIWWGDERFVASDSVDRNAVQAKNALLKQLTLDKTKIHEFPAADAGLNLDEAASFFTEHVEKVSPAFDIVLLGMGPDGHIASLFPGKPTPAAGTWVLAEHDSPKPPQQRLSFSYEALNSANQIWFVVAGADKQDAVSVAMGDSPEDLPVGRVHGEISTQWFIDSTAGTKVFGC